MADKTTVLFFGIYRKTGYFGGSFKMLYRLLKNIDKDSFNVILLTTSESELTMCLSEENIDVKIEIIPLKGSLDKFNHQIPENPILYIPSLIRLAQFNIEAYSILQQADILWCQDLRSFLTIYPHIIITTTPTIWNIGLGSQASGILGILQELSLQTTDKVFIESEIQAKRLFGEFNYEQSVSKFEIFGKGIDLRKFDPTRYCCSRTTKDLQIGTAVSITPRKGLVDLIDAMEHICKRHKNARLKIAGEAPDGHTDYLHSLKERIVEHGIEDSVDFLGWVDEMPDYLASLDVFVLPSHNEGIPGAVREALAMEIPVVATDVGGTSEVVRDNETGFLIEPENPEAIVEAIDYLLENPNERDEMGTRGRELIVSEYSIESYIANYEAFLKEIAKE